jgi:CRP-like cAMP-binding protein
MNDPRQATVQRAAPDTTEAAFKDWLRRLVTGAAELAAFDAGQIDAVMDRDSGSAMLLPEAQSALHGSSRIVWSALDALPGEVCVLDPRGVVVMANKTWSAFGVAERGAGLGVREGGNFFAACRNAPESERSYAEAVATGLRQVLSGTRQSVRVRYACQCARRRRVFTLTMAATAGLGPVNAVVTREWRSEIKRARKARDPMLRNSTRVGTAPPAGAENRLLAELPAKDYARLAPGLETVTITYGEVLYEPGQVMSEVYFPSDCLVSLLTLVEGHRALEVGLVGREGLVGARLALGATTSTVRALVQGTGTALRMKAELFLREFRRSPTLQRVLLKFTDTLMTQISQTAACNRFHIVEARLARWLLMTAERMRSAEFHLTHDFLADMLGVRREGVTLSASALQRRGLISYRRGNITVLDQAGLEAASCSCYRHLQVLNSEGRPASESH